MCAYVCTSVCVSVAPAYAKCIHSKGNILDDDDIQTAGQSFTPQYTFYNWKQLVGRIKEQAPADDTSLVQPDEQTISRTDGTDDQSRAQPEQNRSEVEPSGDSKDSSTNVLKTTKDGAKDDTMAAAPEKVIHVTFSDTTQAEEV